MINQTKLLPVPKKIFLIEEKKQKFTKITLDCLVCKGKISVMNVSGQKKPVCICPKCMLSVKYPNLRRKKLIYYPKLYKAIRGAKNDK